MFFFILKTNSTLLAYISLAGLLLLRKKIVSIAKIKTGGQHFFNVKFISSLNRLLSWHQLQETTEEKHYLILTCTEGFLQYK